MNNLDKNPNSVLPDGQKLFKYSALEFIINFVKARTFNYLTRNASQLFMRGGDVISIGPHIQGCHEPQVMAALDLFAKKGFDDFLLDIGANIGLTSCQSAGNFKKTLMFEPNPLCVNILRTNAAIALSECNYEIREYGLGDRDELLPLRIPKNNWGGAYVVAAQNSYSSGTLAAKDGFDCFDPKNYLTKQIEIKQADLVFENVFNELKNSGLKNGAIKIDVEGFESVVLNAISRSLPSDMSLMIIFESWGGNFDRENATTIFGNRARLHSLAKTPAGAKSRFGKLIAIIIAGGQKFTLKNWSRNDDANDLVLHVQSLNSN